MIIIFTTYDMNPGIKTFTVEQSGIHQDKLSGAPSIGCPARSQVSNRSPCQ